MSVAIPSRAHSVTQLGLQRSHHARPGPARHSYLVVARDASARAAATLVGARINSGILADLSGRWAAMQLSTRGVSGIPFAPFDQPPGSLVQAGRAVWGSLAAAGDGGELVVVVVRTVKEPEDLIDLRACVEQVDEIFRGARLPIRLLACAVMLRPADLIGTESLRELRGLALPPVLLNLFPPSGPLPEPLVPQATAELLEVLAGSGPTALLGPYQDPHAAIERALVVALDAIGVPADAEERYFRIRLTRVWLDGMLRHPSAIAQIPSTPETAARELAEQVSTAAKANLRTVRKAAGKQFRETRRDLYALVAPRLLRPLPLADQQALVAQANERLIRPETGWRDQIFGRLTAIYDQHSTAPGLARIEAYRLAGILPGGIRLAEEYLQETVARLEAVERAHDVQRLGQPGPCDEPSLAIDPAEILEWQPRPRCAPWRTLLGWTALLAAGLVYVNASLPATTVASLLGAASSGSADLVARATTLGALLIALVVAWQAIQFGRVWRARTKMLGLPRYRYRQRLTVWQTWFLHHELPRRFVRDGAGILDEIQLVRERLTVLLDHFRSEESATRAILDAPAFPRVARLDVDDLEDVTTRLEQHQSLDWLANELRHRWQTGNDPAVFGEQLCGLLESMVVTPGIPADDGTVLWDLAGEAVARELGSRRLDSLDSRVADPAGTLSAMRHRAHPTGTMVLGIYYVGDPGSRLARAAEDADCVVLDHLDRDRGTLAAVSIRQL